MGNILQNDKVKILFLGVNNPGVIFYRMFQFAQRMSELGLAHCRMFPEWQPNEVFAQDWESELQKYMPTLEEMVKWADFVVCQYIHSASGLTIVQAIRDLKPCFMEVDDNFSQVPYYSVSYDDNKPGERQDFWATRQVVESHGVITTTEYLKNHYSQWNPNVYVIPNCIDFELWDSMKSHSNERVRIGWIGSSAHEGDLKIVKDPLYEILEKYKNVEVYICCSAIPEWEKHERMFLVPTFVPIEQYPKHLKNLSFDIGLAPLRDNNFNRGKSNLRYLEYAVCKVPTIASNVEPFKKDFVGYIAETDEDWVKYLSMLIEDWDLRLKMGWNGYWDVKEKFNLNTVARRYANLVKDQIWQKSNSLEVRAFEQISMDTKLV